MLPKYIWCVKKIGKSDMNIVPKRCVNDTVQISAGTGARNMKNLCSRVPGFKLAIVQWVRKSEAVS
jgi:hypothetical protein